MTFSRLIPDKLKSVELKFAEMWPTFRQSGRRRVPNLNLAREANADESEGGEEDWHESGGDGSDEGDDPPPPYDKSVKRGVGPYWAWYNRQGFDTKKQKANERERRSKASRPHARDAKNCKRVDQRKRKREAMEAAALLINVQQEQHTHTY